MTNNREKQFRLCERFYYKGQIRPFKLCQMDHVLYGLPVAFTLSEAENNYFKNSPSILKRLKGLQPGTVLKVGVLSRDTELVVVVDEFLDKEELKQMERELDSINKEIAKLTKHLLPKQKELRDKINYLKNGLYISTIKNNKKR